LFPLKNIRFDIDQLFQKIKCMKMEIQTNRSILCMLCMVMCSIGFAQPIPTLEITDRLFTAGFGPNTNAVMIPFENDACNNNLFSVYSPALTMNVSLRNQVYTGLNYSNISTGVVFGGAPSLSSDGPIQAVLPSILLSVGLCIDGKFEIYPPGTTAWLCTKDKYNLPMFSPYIM
jgi:ferredoxin